MATKDLGVPELRWMLLALLAPAAGLIMVLILRKAGGLLQILFALAGLSPLAYNYLKFSEQMKGILTRV